MKPHLKYDSFKVRIPKELIPIQVIEDLRLESNVDAMIIDGEIVAPQDLHSYGYKVTTDGKIPHRKLSNDNNVTAVTITIEKQRTSKQISEYVTLKITSKLLKERYYEGISNDTIDIICNYMNSIGIVIDKETLLKSEITDIDICKDVVIQPTEFMQIVEHVKANTKQTGIRDRGHNIFLQKENKGIEFSTRNRATPNNPYLKIYNKSLDSNSQDHSLFFKTYGITTQGGLHRIEATLKNKAHFKKYKLGNTLADFLNLTQEQLEMIMNDITSIHMDKNRYTEIMPRVNADTDKVYQEQLLKYGTELLLSVTQIINSTTHGIEHPKTRKRHEAKFLATAKAMTTQIESFREKTEIVNKLTELYLI